MNHIKKSYHSCSTHLLATFKKRCCILSVCKRCKQVTYSKTDVMARQTYLTRRWMDMLQASHICKISLCACQIYLLPSRQDVGWGISSATHFSQRSDMRHTETRSYISGRQKVPTVSNLQKQLYWLLCIFWGTTVMPSAHMNDASLKGVPNSYPLLHMEEKEIPKNRARAGENFGKKKNNGSFNSEW